MNIICKLIVITAGFVFLAVNLRNIVKKKMDIGIGSGWTVAFIVFILFGVLFDFGALLAFTRIRNMIMFAGLLLTLILTLYNYGIYITKVKNECDDLTMWVSLQKHRNDAENDGTKADGR